MGVPGSAAERPATVPCAPDWSGNHAAAPWPAATASAPAVEAVMSARVRPSAESIQDAQGSQAPWAQSDWWLATR